VARVARVALVALAAAAFAIAPGCASTARPEGQVVLHVTTDAPVGGAGGLFDRLIVDVLAPGERAPCGGCTRRFAVDDDRMARGRVSFGVMARPGVAGYRARVRLYRSGGTASGEPRPASTLETVVALPTVAEEGIVDATVTLHLTDLARPRGTVDAPVAFEPGAPPAGVVGSVLASHPKACVGEPAEDEVCVPGGVFWMGNPRIDALDEREADGRTERVVFVSPFFLERAEVTVSQLRAARVARVVDDPVEGGRARPECLYTADPGDNDDLPVNCLSWQRARAYCTKVGKRLPSEAEYEYVAGGLEGRSFVWGTDLPQCADAVFARGTICPGPRRPSPAGRGVRDQIGIGGRLVLDLAGNLREMTLDRFRRGDEACWGSGVFADPVCERDSDDEVVPRTVRGGSYVDEGTLLRAAQRSFLENERFGVSEHVGFRCARPGR
jgi:formylglycine-generating enzyme required for sulfatase activity